MFIVIMSYSIDYEYLLLSPCNNKPFTHYDLLHLYPIMHVDWVPISDL